MGVRWEATATAAVEMPETTEVSNVDGMMPDDPANCSGMDIDGDDGTGELDFEAPVTDVDRELFPDLGLDRLPLPLAPLLPATVPLPVLALLLPLPLPPAAVFLDLTTRGGWDEHRPPSWGVPMIKTVSRS